MPIRFRYFLILLLVVFTSPLRSQEEAAPAAEDDTVTLQFPNAEVKSLLLFYEQLSGRKVLYDNSVAGQVPIYINTPVPKSEAIKIIETSLFLNGFFIIPSERENLVKVLGPGKPTRSASIPIYSEESQIPEGEMIISYVFKLHYADPAELQNILTQYLSTGQPYTSFLPLPKSQALLVTESSSTIRSLVGLIRSIDTPPAEVVSEFIQLRRADAAKVVEYLNQIFQLKEQQQQQQQTSAPPPAAGGPSNRRRVVPDDVPQPPEGVSAESVNAFLSEDSVIVGKIKITADTRTNRIHIVTRPVNLPFVRGLITEFDANVDLGEPVTRPLRYVSAGDVLPILVTTLKEPGIETQEAQGGGGGTQPPSGSTSNRGFTGSSGSNSNSGSSGEGSSTVDLNSGLDTQAVDTKPEAVTIGSTKLIADKRANSIIILGNEDARQKVMKVIDEIDVRSPQVMLSAVIGELSLKQGQEFGFSYLLRYFDLGQFSGAGAFRNAIIPLVNPSRLNRPDRFGGGTSTNDNGSSTSTGSLINQGGISGIVTVADSLDIVVHALEATNRFRVTSRPMIFTSNNRPATIASGSEIAVPVSSLTSLDNNSTPVTSSSIQYKKIQLKLNVLPLINSDNEVTLDIEQTLDSPSGSSTIDGNQIPTIASRGLKTSVRIPNRATVVLGGLIQEDNGRDRGGVPILSEIPGLGLLFSNTKKAKNRSELIILIRPVVINSAEDMAVNRNVEEHRLYLPPNLEDDLTPEIPVQQAPKDSPWWQGGSKEVIDTSMEPTTTNKVLKTPRYKN